MHIAFQEKLTSQVCYFGDTNSAFITEW